MYRVGFRAITEDYEVENYLCAYDYAFEEIDIPCDYEVRPVYDLTEAERNLLEGIRFHDIEPEDLIEQLVEEVDVLP